MRRGCGAAATAGHLLSPEFGAARIDEELQVHSKTEAVAKALREHVFERDVTRADRG